MPLTQSSKGSELPLLKDFIQKNQFNGSDFSFNTVQPFYEFVQDNALKKQEVKPLINIIPSISKNMVDQQRTLAAELSQNSLLNQNIQSQGFRINSNVEFTLHKEIPQPPK